MAIRIYSLVLTGTISAYVVIARSKFTHLFCLSEYESVCSCQWTKVFTAWRSM